MKFHYLLFALAACEHGTAFQVPSRPSAATSTSTTVLYGMSRKARRNMEREKDARGRSKQFFDAIEDAQDEGGKKKKKKGKKKVAAQDGSPPPEDDEEARRAAIIEDAERRMQERPETSEMFVDEETGIEVIRQGQKVLDVVTRKAVKLSDLGPEYRLAQMFPGVPPETREKYRFDWNTVDVPEMVDKLREACSVKLEDGSRGIPPHPSISEKGLDFVLANRDLLGHKMSKTLGRLSMRAAWKDGEEEAQKMYKFWKNFETLENHISAPFRQVIQDAEGRVGPNFGNLDIMKYCNGELYERVGNYIVLKGMVAHWEKKVVDANYVETTPQTKENYVRVLAVGDPKRYLPDPPILFTLKECTQVCAMAQQMCNLFVETEELWADMPPEIVFLEESLKIKGGTALRKYMIDEFCPARGITPEGLREGMRRFFQQLDNMQIDPYADLRNKVQDLFHAMAVGTEDERDPYAPYLINFDRNGPGYFQSYTFNHPKNSLVRFLDGGYNAGGIDLGQMDEDDEVDDDPGFFGELFNFGGERKSKAVRQEVTPEDALADYKVPEERSLGRPHELGWLQYLKDESGYRLGEMPPGRIIAE